MDKNLVQRALAGLVFLAVMISGICTNVYTATSLFALLAFFISWEFVSLVNQKKSLGDGRYVIIAFYGLWTLFFILALTGVVKGDLIFSIGALGFFLTAVLVFLLKNEIEKRVWLAAIHFLTLLYAFLPFVLLALLSEFYHDHHHNFAVLFFFILIWTNDTMAYCCGRLFGKTKLAETISPKKTVEGFAGGIVFTTGVSALIWYVWKINLGHPAIYMVAPFVVGLFGTVGDLLESAVKRWVGVKDSGNIIPGHGGLLDRFDGAVFAVVPYLVVLMLLNH